VSAVHDSLFGWLCLEPMICSQVLNSGFCKVIEGIRIYQRLHQTLAHSGGFYQPSGGRLWFEQAFDPPQQNAAMLYFTRFGMRRFEGTYRKSLLPRDRGRRWPEAGEDLDW